MEPLDRTTIKAVCDLICDDHGSHYRKGYQLPLFLRDSGWAKVPDYDFEDGISRGQWIYDEIWARRDDPVAIEQVLCRLADPREYPREQTAPMDVCDRLNRLLGREGMKIVYERGRPLLIEIEPVMDSPAHSAPVSLKADLGKIAQDDAYATILRSRFDEAATCRAYGAHVMAMIALGSLLEGTLHAVALRQGLVSGRVTLEKLIDIADTEGWIKKDRHRFSHTLRQYRNLVHPHAQLRQGETPDARTVSVCWEVAVAALNDLGDYIIGESQ